MFNRTKTMTIEPPTKLLQPFTISTKEIIGQGKEDIPTLDISHLKKMSEFTNRDDVKNKVLLCKMLRLGFTLVVNSAYIFQNFKYHASLIKINDTNQINSVAEYDASKDVRWQDVVYNGEIPEFILDNIYKIPKELMPDYSDPNTSKDSYIHFSIHSNEPMPVSYVPSAYIDPVVIAWCGYPGFRFKYNIDYKQGNNEFTCNNVDGLVLGIWNEEGKEI